MCTTPPVSSASATSRWTMMDSASPGIPPQPERRCRKPFVGHALALQRLVFAVIDDRHVEHARVLERPAHQQRSSHRAAIIGDRHAPGLAELRDVGELLAFLTARHGTNG